ncbi:RNA polymerase sigma-70 factor [Coprobacter tertius]|uniref:RNA polymerase sigma-70 factor n=1 Tax=Coprobacter tertius TaxID=2944915 RepID=A0ABT1MKK7_9BACT|nr:RNA polymerase sigma-70 factor [Coprobacter tertius]MCP9612233.1 RNA polymerase sigma-70 factor [Coprobacter tertius]
MQYNINQYLEADDDELFALIEKGDEKAFTRVYEKYHKLLYVVAYRYLMNREMAEDIVQQVFVRLWEYRAELRVGVNLKNYLFTMTKNHVLNQIRDNNTALTKNYEITQRETNYDDNLIEKLENKELMCLFYKAINLLPSQKRDICLMKVSDELSNKDIADKLGLSVNTIKTHYSEALKLLRLNLSKMLIIVIILTLITFLSVHFTIQIRA